ncbi:MAG: UPF0158 family protein [Bacteroidota bacterium]
MKPNAIFQQALEMDDPSLRNIQEEVSSGFRVFVHKQDFSVQSIPDEMNLSMYGETEPWEEAIAEIETNRDHYIEIPPISSRHGFEIRERFAESISQDPTFQGRLFKALERKKPFRNFRYEVDDSSYLQDWYDFESAERELYVLKQLVEKKFGHEKLWELEEQVVHTQQTTTIPTAPPNYQAVLEQARTLTREQQFELVSELLKDLQDQS